MFDLRDTHGRAKRSSQPTASDRLIVPAECAARSSSMLFVSLELTVPAGANTDWVGWNSQPI